MFLAHAKNAWDGPKWGQNVFSLLIQTLPTFWAERIWILRSVIFVISWTPKFWISRSPDFQDLAWARLGLGLGPSCYTSGGHWFCYFCTQSIDNQDIETDTEVHGITQSQCNPVSAHMDLLSECLYALGKFPTCILGEQMHDQGTQTKSTKWKAVVAFFVRITRY